MKPKIRAVGQYLRSKLATDTRDKARFKHACATAVSALQTTLNIVQDVAGTAGPPGLQAGIKGLILILDVVQKMSQNAQDIEQLVKRIGDMMTVLQDAKDRGMLSETILGRIGRLSDQWTSVADEVRKMPSRNIFERAVHYNDDVQSINNYVKDITSSMERFKVESMLTIECTLEEQKNTVHRIEGNVENVAQKVDNALQQLNAKPDVKDLPPPHAVYAGFDCKVGAPCLGGTRTHILEQVDEWINARDALASATESLTRGLPIFWINGSAGSGKTTIAYTVAEACRKRKILGASFFCSRDNAECSNPNLIFPTMAYQLGLFFPPFKAGVTLAVMANPDIGYSGVSYQLEELIVKPLRAVGESFPPCVIVLDALDECKDGGATSIILSALSRHVDELSPLKILVTSRPERNITQAFSNCLRPATQRVILHEIKLEVVQNDIELYLSANLHRVRESHDLVDSSWPSMEDIHALTLLSVGLFIFALTSVKFIEDRNYSDPRHQLSELLRNTAETVSSSLSPHRHLDQLYMGVLTRAFPDMSDHLADRLKAALGTIVLLRDPLSPIALERLVNLGQGTVRVTLLHLHLVVIVPDDDVQVIRLHHPSFFDFMTSPTRCLNPKLVVDLRIQHTFLTRECLRVMKNLRRDICGIKNPSILNNEVDDLETRIARNIPTELQYACRHWAFHLTNSTMSHVLLGLVKEFCSKYLLYWVEACSLLGELRSALLTLNSAQKALANAGQNMADTTALLHDCERFTRQFFPVINTCSLQVYDSALLFTPEETLLYRTYQQELVVPLKLYNASEKTWDPCMRTMEGHSSLILSVAFSPDGTRVVSGSGDKTLRFWDAVSGTHLNTLEGHLGRVRAVAFSPDGISVVSGSDDHTVRLWDAASGVLLDIEQNNNSARAVVNFLTLTQPSLSQSHASPLPQSTSIYFIENGWLCSLPQTQRLCWIPVSCRPMTDACVAWNGDRVAVGTGDGRVVILDLTSMNSYLKSY